jgi:N6-adenosine-specific RNA methylase IME4
MGAEVDLRCQDVRAMIASLPDGCAAFVMADPPWEYRISGTGMRTVAGHYQDLPEQIVLDHLTAAYRIAAPTCYLAVWCTFPKLIDWIGYNEALAAVGWQYVSGGAWGKTNGIGLGFHFRGDAELCLLYRKGQPQPLDGSKSNLWLAHRTETHSEKPQIALRALVSMAAPVGGLVVDCYAGESAFLARACRALGRRYVGAELDPARHARALVRLSQQEMLLEATA